MKPGIQYGVLLGVAFAAAFHAGAFATALLCGLIALQLEIGAFVVWLRTALPLAALANLSGAVAMAAGAVLFGRGYDIFSASLPAAVFYAGVLLGSLLLFIESRVHRAEWIEWRAHMEPMSLLDVMTGRHIPRLRQRSA